MNPKAWMKSANLYSLCSFPSTTSQPVSVERASLSSGPENLRILLLSFAFEQPHCNGDHAARFWNKTKGTPEDQWSGSSGPGRAIAPEPGCGLGFMGTLTNAHDPPDLD